MKKLIYLLFLSLAAISSACGNKDANNDEKPILAVSIEPQRKMLTDLVGDNFQIVTLLSAGANPESYEPTISQRAALSKAQAYFTIGYLPFEEKLAASLPADRVVNSSLGIVPITGTHSHHHADSDADHESHSDADPHVWTSLRNGKKMAANMLASIIALDPENAQAYAERFAKLEARLDSLDAVAADQLSTCGAHAFAVWHPSLSYYARDYGLHQISVGYESKEAPISLMRAVVDEARADSVSVFFFQKEYDSRQARNINSEIGSNLIEINPLGYEWEDEIMRITNELCRQ